jgi:protein-tyrosine phosphatase
MAETFDRHLRFKSVHNFRDIGGYRGHKGKTVAWRRVFRSGEFRNITREDLERMTKELGVNHVIDLRSGSELKNNGNGLLEGCGIKYCNIAFMKDENGDPPLNYGQMTHLGDFYLALMSDKDFGGKVVQALEMIADPKNHPLVFHCAVGKDRTGMLAAMLFKLLGVKETDIIQDYTLSGPYMAEVKASLFSNPKTHEAMPQIPDILWSAVAPSMEVLLANLKREYGSAGQYLRKMGMDDDLPRQLRSILLT